MVVVSIALFSCCFAHASDESVSSRWSASLAREAARHEARATNDGLLSKIALIYYAPPSLASTDVGLEKAVAILENTTKRQVWWMNTADIEGAKVTRKGEVCEFFLQAGFDHLMFKSNWDYVVDKFARDYLWHSDGSACNLTRSLQLAGSYPPPAAPASTRFYDFVFYETEWYAESFPLPHSLHAFGIDTDSMRARCHRSDKKNKQWDWLFVGAFADHAGFKRPERLAERTGRRLAVGKLKDNSGSTSSAAELVVGALERAGVTVQRAPVPWDQLADLIASAHNVLVPDDWRGGGERIVLETRACGVNVVIEPDNPKLWGLSTGPLYSSLYYAGQLEKGILDIERRVNNRPKEIIVNVADSHTAPAVDFETCGIAPLHFPLNPDRWCWNSHDFAAGVDLSAIVPSVHSK